MAKNEVKIKPLSKSNFSPSSLDSFVRTLEVKRVYRRDSGYITYLALDGENVVGFIGLMKELVEGYMILDLVQVSQAYRKGGIGRRLFEKGIEEAKKAGAKGLYISACSSEETIAFYRAMGAEVTDTPIKSIADDEPYDLQMVRPV